MLPEESIEDSRRRAKADAPVPAHRADVVSRFLFMSDSSLPIESLGENNSGLELDLVSFFNNLRINSRENQENISSSHSTLREIISCNDLNNPSNTSQNLNISNNSTNSNNLNMPVPALDIKNLSIIPNFDGNPNKLYRFISASESILTHYFDKTNLANFQNVLLMNGILNKLEGRAEEVIAINGADSWDDIKNTLLQNFGDQRDENCLNQDLVNLRQKPNETPHQFHKRVLHLLNTICNYIDLRCAEGERHSKRDFFTKQALKTFVAGLKEPLGPMIRAMRPTSLAQAIQFITEEENIKYYQRSNQFNPVFKKPVMQNRPIPQPQIRHFPQPSTSFAHPSTSSQFPRGPINIQSHTTPPVQKFPTNAQTFGKPQNVWKPNPKAPQPKPVPMSMSTRNTTPQFKSQYRNNYFQGNSQKPNFASEELFNTEFNEPQPDYTVEYSLNEQQEPDYSYPYTDEQTDYENFQETLEPTDQT